ncbi:MAG TPA: GreA/GreB family elongation factor [Prolixibacteraceae bacterium]|nr:GreA/GreB family elongation factor [Prolixibacteraceae bacterium]
MAKKTKISQGEFPITVTQLDFVRLSKLIQMIREDKSIDIEYLNYLGVELKRAAKINSKKITPDFVTMNSVMEVTLLETGKRMELRLVYPNQADFSKGLISVLSPLGCALLGYKNGDIVSFKAPMGEQKVRIEKVIYQPEAHGEDLE